jgi:hypothetical protein
MPSMTSQKCKCCKQSFQARTADVKRGWGLYCSKRCKAIMQEKKNGQHAAYLNGRGVSNLHPERLEDMMEYSDDVHPYSSDGHGQWND